MEKADTQGEHADALALSAGTTLLNGQYKIRSCLGRGGFGAIYSATNSLERTVVIKECFPEDFCIRDNDQVRPKGSKLVPQFEAIKKQFFFEARQMAMLEHENIVAVHQVFEENNTVYMALSEVHGLDLVSLVETNTKRITRKFLRKITEQSLTVLEFIHRNGFLHRDISPDNMMVDENDHLILIDFGAARPTDGTARPSVYAVKDGYSPCELYEPRGRHTFASDLYALGASLHYLVTGYSPPDSVARLQSLKAGQSDPYVPLAQDDWSHDYDILKAIDQALIVQQNERFQSVDCWRSAMNATSREKPKMPVSNWLSADFEAEIKQMVEMTNRELCTRTVSNTTSKKCPDAVPAQVERTVVDIFGDPIEDVATWLETQEEERRASIARADEEDAMQECEVKQEGIAEQQSLLGHLLSRCFSRDTNILDEKKRMTRSVR